MKNYDGLKRGHIFTPGAVPLEAYTKLLQFALYELAKAPEIQSAHGIVFKRPDPVSDEDVVNKQMLMPVEIYNDNGDEDLILVNHILEMNIEAAIQLQFFAGEIGAKYIRVPPQEWITLPHRFYTGYLKSGRPAVIGGSTGRERGKGNREKNFRRSG